MERKRRAPVSDECRFTINRLVAYLLHISDAYLFMACYYVDVKGMPPFAMFFEEEAELKRHHAKPFLRFLKKRDSMICLPVIKKAEMENWGSAIQALTSALQMENTLKGILGDLKDVVSEARETELRPYVIEFLEKEKRNLIYLEGQISSQMLLEEKKLRESKSEMSAGASASGGET